MRTTTLRLALLMLAVLAASATATDPSVPVSSRPSHREWLARPFHMLGVDYGPYSFELTPEGWFRGATATLIIEQGGVSPDRWTWAHREPGVAVSRIDDADGEPGVVVTAAAVTLPDLQHEVPPERVEATRFGIGGTVENPILIVRLGVSPAATGNASRRRHTDGASSHVVIRLWSDTGRDFGGLLSDAIAAGESRRPARWINDPVGRGVAIADSLVLTATTQPDSILHVLRPDGSPEQELVELAFTVTAGQPLELRFPYFGIPLADRALVESRDGTSLIDGTHRYWTERTSNGTRVTTPEAAVDRAALASLYHILAGSFVAGQEQVAVLGGPFLYRQIYVRDAAFVIVALDRFGYHADARAAIDFLFDQQLPSGEIVSQNGQRDGNGQALWALGEHLIRTRDRRFAQDRMKPVGRLVDRIRALIEPQDRDVLPFHPMMPRTNLQDAEQIDRGHIVGYNLWTYRGLESACDIARIAGATDSATAWSAVATAFGAALDLELDDLLARTGGLVTPAFEGLEARSFSAGFYGEQGGLDWGNLQLVFPCALWSPTDPRLQANLDAWTSRLVQGLYPYPYGGDFQLVHHYLTTSIAHTLLAHGGAPERRHLFRIFYDGLLGHVTGTFGGCEIIDVDGHDVWPRSNTSPHNTFAARYLLLLSDMLAQARGDTLAIGGGLSPAWLMPGQRVAGDGIATPFGWIDVTCAPRATSAGRLLLDVEIARRSTPPARTRQPVPARPPARLPVDVSGAPDRPVAVVFDAPLGFTLVTVDRVTGAGTEVLLQTDQRVVFSPGVETFTVLLQGAADDRWSVEAAAARLRRR